MKMFKLMLIFFSITLSSWAYANPSLIDTFNSANPIILSEFISSHSILLYLAVFFLLGVLLAFTPCVLPMVPILSGIIIQQERDKSFRLSLSYVLGMAVMYALAGMGAALVGASLQSSLQNPYVLSVFSLLFIILGLNLLGLFELKLPTFHFIQKRKQKGGYIQTACMGALSTLIVSPCVTAPLIGVLSYISQTQQIVTGGLILFVLAMGMGLPLLLVGAGGGKLLPKAGPWMNGIKYTFGFMMFGMSIYLAGRFLPQEVSTSLWALLLIGIGLFISIKSPTQHKAIYILSVLLSSLGITHLYQGIAATDTPIPHQTPAALFKSANSVQAINQALKEAKAYHQKVFLDFYASWCSDCTAMDAKVFTQRDVQTIMKDFVSIRVDITEDTATQRDIKKAFHIYGTPTLQFYTAEGELQHKLTAAGYINKDAFLKLIRQV